MENRKIWGFPALLVVELLVAALFFGFVAEGVYEGLRLDNLDMVSAFGLALCAMVIQTVGFVAVGQRWYRSFMAMIISIVFVAGALTAILFVEREYYLLKMVGPKAVWAEALKAVDALGPRMRDAEVRVTALNALLANAKEVQRQAERLATGEATGSSTGKVGKGPVFLALGQIAGNAKDGVTTIAEVQGQKAADLEVISQDYAALRGKITKGGDGLSVAEAYTALSVIDGRLGAIFGVNPGVFMPKLTAVREGLESLKAQAPSLAASIVAVQQTEASARASLEPLAAVAPVSPDLRQPLPAEAVRIRLAQGDFATQYWQITFLFLAMPIGILLFSALMNQDGIRRFWREGWLDEKLEHARRRHSHKLAMAELRGEGFPAYTGDGWFWRGLNLLLAGFRRAAKPVPEVPKPELPKAEDGKTAPVKAPSKPIDWKALLRKGRDFLVPPVRENPLPSATSDAGKEETEVLVPKPLLPPPSPVVPEAPAAVTPPVVTPARGDLPPWALAVLMARRESESGRDGSQTGESLPGKGLSEVQEWFHKEVLERRDAFVNNVGHLSGLTRALHSRELDSLGEGLEKMLKLSVSDRAEAESYLARLDAMVVELGALKPHLDGITRAAE